MALIHSNEFPFLLKQAVPKLSKLYYSGNKTLLEGRHISFVGTRDVTEYGKWVISKLLCASLSKTNIVIVSGLARGVDAYVHKICLERNIKAIAIVPGAIESAIPKCNLEIFNQLKKQGLILAEYPEGTVVRKEMFVLRNRLVAAISEATIVIEAGIKSGSLITANLALEYNRDIYAVPGNIDSKVSQGCNLLAKHGAGVITGIEDFKEILGMHEERMVIGM